MKTLYTFPDASVFNRNLPKSKIYEHAVPNARVKNLFVSQVERITWTHKLAPATINLPESDGVDEIQIFSIILKCGDLASDVVLTIDRAIPSPIVLALHYAGKTRYTAAFKRPSEGDSAKWVVGNYLQTDWMDDTNAERRAMPVATSMGALYRLLLAEISSLPLHQEEGLDNFMARVDLLGVKQRAVNTLQQRMIREKQFNRRVELNRSLKALQLEIEQLQG